MENFLFFEASIEPVNIQIKQSAEFMSIIGKLTSHHQDSQEFVKAEHRR